MHKGVGLSIITSGFNDNLLHEDSKDSMSGMETVYTDCVRCLLNVKNQIQSTSFFNKDFSKFELHLI